MEKAGSQATSIRSASGCCCAMHSTNWARRWWEGAATTSTSPRNVPESGWAPAKTVSCGTTPCAATAPYATQSCTAWQKANGPRLRDTWNTCCEPIMLIDFFYHLRARKLPVSVQERSEGHTSELQSLMRNSYAGLCLKKKTNTAKVN